MVFLEEGKFAKGTEEGELETSTVVVFRDRLSHVSGYIERWSFEAACEEDLIVKIFSWFVKATKSIKTLNMWATYYSKGLSRSGNLRYKNIFLVCVNHKKIYNENTFRSTSYSLSTISDSLELVCATLWAPHTHTLPSQYLHNTHMYTRCLTQWGHIGTLPWEEEDIMFYILSQDQFNTHRVRGVPYTHCHITTKTYTHCLTQCVVLPYWNNHVM